MQGPAEVSVKAASGRSVCGCDDTAGEDPPAEWQSDVGEAFGITALDAYASDLAPEGALSVAWIRQNPGEKNPTKRN